MVHGGTNHEVPRRIMCAGTSQYCTHVRCRQPADNSAALQVSEEVVDEQLALEDVPDDGSAEAADDDAPVSQPARID